MASSAENFIIGLLTSAGIAASLAAQLARSYLVNHGVPVSAITAANILEVLGLQLTGGRIQQTVGSVTLTATSGGALPVAIEAAAPTAQEEEQIAQAVAESSGGAVSAQAVASAAASNNLSAADAAAFGQFQAAQVVGGSGGTLPIGQYAFLESRGLIDTVDAGGFEWWS